MTAYFSGVMVRLMLTLTPCLCVLGGIGLSVTIERVVSSEPVTASTFLFKKTFDLLRNFIFEAFVKRFPSQK